MSVARASAAPGARTVQFRAGGPRIPLDLVRARDAGEVVFVVGAGASRGSGLPSFEGLTRTVFEKLAGADPAQPGIVPHAEHAAFKNAAYDVALGLLEDRLDGGPSSSTRLPSRRVRDAVARALSADKASSLDQHRDLLILSRDLSGRPRIVTTNFDTLFERAWPIACGTGTLVRSRAGGDLPGAGTPEFAGVLHLHGRLADPITDPATAETDLVLTGADFGDAYLRSGWAARFLYDLVRRYQLVLVGYGAEDPPLKYLLNVISADRRRFSDLKAIYAFDSIGNDGDEVTQTWLAKGIKPLLYEADARHTQLYDTLSEWAASVDNPQGWAERRLRAVAGRTHAEVDGEERGVIELLLASPTNCNLFKAFGADFSWVRAVEEWRPSETGSSSGSSRFRPDGGAYPESLRAWLNGRLEEPAAMAWAVDRLSPLRERSHAEAAGASKLEGQREVAGSTAVRGFSPDELSILDDLIERQAKSWTAPTRRFWSLLSQAADGGRGFYERYAYGIMERLEIEGAPDLGDIERLARFLRPRLRIERPWRWPTEEAEASYSIPFDPATLASRSLHWDGHPGHREVCAALPEDARWLALLLRALEAELDRVYRLAAQMGWLEEGHDLLQRFTHRVATEPHWTDDAAADEDQPSDPDRYQSDHRALIRVISGAWEKLAGLDPSLARRIAEGWQLREEALYQRLYLHALRRSEVFAAEDVVRILALLSDDELWNGHAETTLAIVARWRSLPETDRTQLEARLRRGPPVELWTQGTEDQKRQWQRARARRLLAVLAREGGPLLPESTEFVAEMAQGWGQDKTELTTDDLLPGGVHVRYVPEGDASKFANIDGVDLVVALETAGDERDVGGSNHAAAFVRTEPERTLAALLAAPNSYGAHSDLWRELLWRLSEDDWIRQAPIEQKQRVLEAIGKLHGEALETAILAAARWLEKCAVGRDDVVLPFLLSHQSSMVEVWHYLAAQTFHPTGHALENRLGADQGERLMQQAYNSAAGELAFVGLALLDRARRAPEEFKDIANRADGIETAIREANDRVRFDVAARLAEWAHLAAVLMPQAAEALVLGPISGDQDDSALCLLDLHALYGRGLTLELYQRLEPIMVREAKRDRLSPEGVARLVGRLTWRTLHRLAGAHETGLSAPDLRSVLQRTSDEGRRAAADAMRDWLQRRPHEERAGAWERVGKPFFDQCWPFDVALRSPGLSQHLARIPALLGTAFSDAVATIIPLLVPFEVWDVDTIFLYFGDRQQTDEGQVIANTSLRREAAAAAWSAAIDILDAALGSDPKVVPHDLADWLDDLRARAPEARVVSHGVV